jgi:microsomal dipeptidase-like Zn-dependent dipeptidase
MVLVVLLVCATATTAAAETEVFARGTDGALWHFDGSAWQSLGGEVVGSPDPCSWGSGRIDVFVRGANNTLRQIARTNGQWSQWYDLGGELTSSPTCVAWGANRLDVFARGSDGTLVHKAWDGSRWTEWESLGGELPAGAAPDAASWGVNRLDVFVRGVDNALWQAAWDGTAWGWHSLGGEIASDPGAVSWGANRMDIFARGTDGQMWQIAWDGSQWTEWIPHGGQFDAGSAPDAASSGAGRLEVVARGSDSAVWSKRWNGSEWSEWVMRGGEITSDPGAVAVRGASQKAPAQQAVKQPPAEAGVKPETQQPGMPAVIQINPDVVRNTPPVQQQVPPVIQINPDVVQNAPRVNDPQVPRIDIVISEELTRVPTYEGWNFEDGLQHWTATGSAFEHQPTFGDNVISDRVKVDMRLENNGIGGDYWKRIPYPIGHQGNYWIGTYENRPDDQTPLGTIAGDEPTGTLVSPEFRIVQPNISFLIGGGNDLTRLRFELLLRVNRTQAEQAKGAGGQLVRIGNDDYIVGAMATGQRSEVMRRERWDVSAHRERVARLRIVDENNGAWGHINIDDIRLSDALPPPQPPRVWGFADTHTHPSNYLAFGGGLIQGRLYAPDGNPRTALPDYLGNVNAMMLGTLGVLFGPVASVLGPGVPPLPPDPALGAAVAQAAFAATAPSRRGYPEHNAYPKFNNTMGQQMYREWIRRAYDGGLRLMSALGVNNWLVSSHQLKRGILGSTAPIDDRASADLQVADIKRWVNEIENRSWVEIAYTPEDARRIIGQNKLAIILGVELDLLGNFAPNRTWDAPEIVVLNPEPRPGAEEEEVRRLLGAELDRLYAMGVRQITPFHYVSGVFGGTAMFERLFNEQNRKFTGRNVVVDSGAPWGIRYRLNNDGWGILDGIIRTAATGQPAEVQSDPSWANVPLGHINDMDLTRTGEILVEEVARRAMILDIDHAGYKSTEDILNKARAMDYPVLSSHSDFVELGLTGNGEFARAVDSNDHPTNYDRFGTTQHSSLAHEGMGTRSKYERIAALDGVVAPVISTYRRRQHNRPAGRAGVLSDNEGSSKTWAQMYLYAVDVTGGRGGVALGSDRGMINFISPRFGPNSAYMLAGEEFETLWRYFRGAQVAAQTNGVRYDTPIREWRDHRFKAAGRSAYEYTRKPWEHEDAWKAIAAYKAGRNPWTMGVSAEIPPSGDPLHMLRILNFVKGFFSNTEAEVWRDCSATSPCLGETLPERYAAYLVKKGMTPAELSDTNWRDNASLREHYEWVLLVWQHWLAMEGRDPRPRPAHLGPSAPPNDPLRRHVFGNRDFDVNIDGVAHYGMLPDLLQDLRNVGLTGTDLSPLFRSAEDYIRMWEKAERRKLR